MKRFYFTMMALAAVAFVSCVQQEQPFDDVTFGENDLAFTLGGVSTKASATLPRATKGISIPIGNDGKGNALFLEETIEELNPSPETKGTPAYTANVGKLYTTMGVYANQGSFGGVKSFQVMDMYDHKGDPYDPNAPTAADPDATVGDGWRYTYSYSGNPWPDASTSVNFYFNMPVEPSGVNITERQGTHIKFSYTSPTTGEDQEDILFSHASYSKTQHDGYLPYGAPVLMYHALTGVKFRNGHPNDHQTRTIITKVKFTGLLNSGTCTVDPSAENVVVWVPGNSTGSFSQEFDNPAYSTGQDGTISTWNSDLTGTSWTTAAADKNLNDDDGSLTFWFVPQEISTNVKLEVSFVIKTPDTPNGSGEYTHIIDFGELVGSVEWKAGQLRTYTVKPFDVDVEIKDVISETIKSNLHIANTGNVDEYVRMLVIGNWYGWETAEDYNSFKTTGKPEPSVLVGYTTDDVNNHTMVLPWYREGYPCTVENDPTTIDTSLDGPNYDGPRVDPYGHFDGTFKLAKLGDRDGKRDDWADASGGFYYTMPIGPGEGVNSQTSATKDLFKSYTVTNVPTIYIATNGIYRTPAVGVHLIMEVVVQAIAVPLDENGKPTKWWLEAWHDATGLSKLDPEDSRNSTYKALYAAGEYNPENL